MVFLVFSITFHRFRGCLFGCQVFFCCDHGPMQKRISHFHWSLQQCTGIQDYLRYQMYGEDISFWVGGDRGAMSTNLVKFFAQSLEPHPVVEDYAIWLCLPNPSPPPKKKQTARQHDETPSENTWKFENTQHILTNLYLHSIIIMHCMLICRPYASASSQGIGRWRWYWVPSVPGSTMGLKDASTQAAMGPSGAGMLWSSYMAMESHVSRLYINCSARPVHLKSYLGPVKEIFWEDVLYTCCCKDGGWLDDKLPWPSWTQSCSMFLSFKKVDQVHAFYDSQETVPNDSCCTAYRCFIRCDHRHSDRAGCLAWRLLFFGKRWWFWGDGFPNLNPCNRFAQGGIAVLCLDWVLKPCEELQRCITFSNSQKRAESSLKDICLIMALLCPCEFGDWILKLASIFLNHWPIDLGCAASLHLSLGWPYQDDSWESEPTDLESSIGDKGMVGGDDWQVDFEPNGALVMELEGLTMNVWYWIWFGCCCGAWTCRTTRWLQPLTPCTGFCHTLAVVLYNPKCGTWTCCASPSPYKTSELTTIPARSSALTGFEFLCFTRFADMLDRTSWESLRWLVSWSGLDLHGSFLCPFWPWSCHTSGWTKPLWWLVPPRIASIFAPELALQKGWQWIECWRLAMMFDVFFVNILPF